jgi:hypothetical protein
MTIKKMKEPTVRVSVKDLEGVMNVVLQAMMQYDVLRNDPELADCVVGVTQAVIEQHFGEEFMTDYDTATIN